jgi:ribonuclease Z
MSELRFVFLGTSSGRPTPRRSLSAVYLQYAGDSILFDCGEGTQLQMLRAGTRSSRLVAIAISHFHGDHINGLPGFIGTMGLSGHEDPLRVVGPRGIEKYFMTLRELGILRPQFPIDIVHNEVGVVIEDAAYTVETVKTDHRITTHGYIFRERDLPGRFDLERARALGVPAGPLFGQLQRGASVKLADGRTIESAEVMGPTRRGRSVAYVPDTRPSKRVVEQVRGVDVLIHEATYTQEFADQAIDRKHSTSVEAARVALEAGVGRLVLTHISPKLGNGKLLLDEARAIFPNTDLADDLSEFAVPVPE